MSSFRPVKLWVVRANRAANPDVGGGFMARPRSRRFWLGFALAFSGLLQKAR
jgi:hypothetical protein